MRVCAATRERPRPSLYLLLSIPESHLGDRLRHWLRWLFILNGIANRSLIFAFAFDIEALTLAAAFLSWVVGLPVAAVRMALMFRSMAE